jgi:hypothetical protein
MNFFLQRKSQATKSSILKIPGSNQGGTPNLSEALGLNNMMTS